MSKNETQAQISQPTEGEEKERKFKIYNLHRFIYLSKKERLEEVKERNRKLRRELGKEDFKLNEQLATRDKIKESKTKFVKVHWFYGKPNTGKTYAMDEAIIDKIDKGEVKPYQIFEAQSKACCPYYLDFAKYMDTKIVYIDNLWHDDDYVKLRDIVKFINGSYFRVKCEGQVYIQPEEIYIASLQKPEEIYEKYKKRGDEDYLILINHIVELREFKTVYKTKFQN